MSKIKVGVIGAGGNAEAHMRACVNSGVAQLVAIADPDADRLRLCAEKYGVPHVYSSYEELLEKSDVEAVVVSIPNFLHHRASIAALDSGRHVLCEKPMAIDVESAEAMLAAEKKSGKLLQIGMSRRHSFAAHWLKEEIDRGQFGHVYHARANYIRRRGIPRFGGWFTTKELSGGGPLIDIGVHALDFTWYLLGTPKPVSVLGATHARLGHRKIGVQSWAGPVGQGTFDVEDYASALIRFDNGASIALEVSWAAFTKPNRTIEILGTEQGAVVTGNDIEVLTEKDGEEIDRTVSPPEGASAGGFLGQFKSFIGAIRGEHRCVAPADQGLAVTKMLVAIYQSAETGQEVILS